GQSVLPVLGPAQRLRLRRVALSAEPRLQPDGTASRPRLLGARGDPRRLPQEPTQPGEHVMNNRTMAFGLARGIAATAWLAYVTQAQAQSQAPVQPQAQSQSREQVRAEAEPAQPST